MLFRSPIPVRLPAPVQSLLGPGGPALNVSGSESIRLSGTSNWTNQQLSLLGQRQSLFPSLDMQQDLDIRLEVRNASGTVVASADPAVATVDSDRAKNLDAHLTTNLAAGTYSIAVDGTGSAVAISARLHWTGPLS